MEVAQRSWMLTILHQGSIVAEAHYWIGVSGVDSHLEHYIPRPTSLDSSVAAQWASWVPIYRSDCRSGARANVSSNFGSMATKKDNEIFQDKPEDEVGEVCPLTQVCA